MSATNDLNSICYSRNFLTQVIARIDLVSPISSLAADLPKAVSKAALPHFPIPEPKPAVAHEMLVTPKETHTKKQEFTEWNFIGRNREKRLTLTQQSLVVAYQRYEKYETLRDEFRAISEVFFDEFPEAQPSRLGLRYVNEIELPTGDTLDWNELIDESLLGLFSFSIEGSQPARVFHNLEFVFDGFNLRFHFGVHNPDYPAPIRRKLFILDFDAYYQGLLESDDLPDTLDTFHAEIQKLFERTATDRFREVLHEED